MEKVSFEQKKVRKHWLVQRGKLKDIKLEEVVNINSLIEFDYMGSAEFEFGALSKSLQRILQDFPNYNFFEVIEVQDLQKNPMQIFCKKEVFEEVKENALYLVENPYNCKEYCDIQDYITERKQITNNFWWDIRGDYFIFFNDSNRCKLSVALTMERSKK